jgi:hypothetical protein
MAATRKSEQERPHRHAPRLARADLLRNHQDSAPADLRALKQVLEGVI